MAAEHNPYWEAVDLKYQIYNGLFLSLPYYEVRRAGILLPVFAAKASRMLAEGHDPQTVVSTFVDEQLGESTDEKARTDLIFRFLQLVERQVVLFDALEDAAFERVHDLEGPGTIHDVLTRIVTPERKGRFAEVLEDFRVRIVLTAHPTQFYPNAILGIITDLADALAKNDTTAVYDLLLQLGRTRSRNRRKPTPLDEAESLLWFLENVFYDAAVDVHQTLTESALEQERDSLLQPAIVELGFWPGGDRDGNPYVDAATTRAVASMLRGAVLSRYAGELEQISRRLTFDGAIERVAEIEKRIEATIEQSREGYAGAHELLGDLVMLWDHVHEQHSDLFIAGVERLIHRVQVFGFHFATLDLRQDSRIHRSALGRVFPDYGAADTVDARFGFLESWLAEPDSASSSPDLSELADDPVLADTIEALRAAVDIRALGGERSLHRYIISNTRDEANVLEVLALCRLAVPDAPPALDIVPLFETVDDLRRAPAIMRRLYASPIYRRHLADRRNRQTIMLGFSDGTKDGGYVTANWLIYRAKEALTAVSREAEVRVVFFEGRGGPPARGGGKTHQFYRAVGSNVARDQIHLTIQGQTVSSNYGTPAAARYNLEQLVSAGLENLLLPEENSNITDLQGRLLDELSETSLRMYSELKQRADFVPYLESMTPLVYYGKANNASRPTSRGSGGALRLEDLRAIPFVGAWSQMKQNVPGYYGFGTALHELIDAGRLSELQHLFADNLFFRTLVENSMQSLGKVNFEITRYIGADERFGELWRALHAEYERAVHSLKRVAGSESLTPGDSSLASSISLREQIVLPVLAIQQFALAALRDIREGDGDSQREEILGRIVVKSMAAIVNAARNAV